MGVLWGKKRGGAIGISNNLVFTFGGYHVCANFGEMRPLECAQTDTHIDRQRQTDFIICPMLYIHLYFVIETAKTNQIIKQNTDKNNNAKNNSSNNS